MSTLVGVVVTAATAFLVALAAATGIVSLASNDPEASQGYVKNDVPVYGKR